MRVADVHPMLAQTAGMLLPHLDDPQVREIRCTSAGRVFVIHSHHGKQLVGEIQPLALDTFLALAASVVGAEWRASSPRLHMASTVLGWRIQASMPPVSPNVCMVLRKHPREVYPLRDFVQKGILTAGQADILTTALHSKHSILVTGAWGSSKTTLLNALLHELRDSDRRILIVEDDPELHSEAADVEYQRTVDALDGTVAITMADLCKDLLRNSPDLIVVGEVRDGRACLDMLKAAGTGHPVLCTLHADSAHGTLLRLEQLVAEVAAGSQRPTIAAGVDLICHKEQYERLWRCTGLLAVHGLAGEAYELEPLA